MKRLFIVALVGFSALFAVAAGRESSPSGPSAPPASPASTYVRSISQEREYARTEGEERFRTNCGRCHQSPHKFAPRMMGTIVRHMRVRAMLTDDDMKFILAYMTE